MASAEHGSEHAREAQDVRLVDARLIVDTIPTLAWAARSDGSADFFNQRWLDYTGLSAEEARDWGWTAAITRTTGKDLRITGDPFWLLASRVRLKHACAASMANIGGFFSVQLRRLTTMGG